MTPPRGRLLEVIVSTVDDARAALEGGADRVEVVASLDQDGLTPSRALVEALVADVAIPLRVMVRPADVFTVTDPGERAAIVEDARQWADLPLDGIVTGYVTPEGAIDEELLAQVAEASGHRVTFHRAIERVTTVGAAKVLRRHPQVDRILSGGGSGDWTERRTRLEQLQREASPITVIVGGGVDATGADALIASPLLRELHVGRTVRHGGRVEGAVDVEAVKAMAARIARAGVVPPAPDPSARQSR